MNESKTLEVLQDIENCFMYHKPFGDQVERYADIRAAGKSMAAVLASYCPESDELAEAIKSLRSAVMWANASIACNEQPDCALCNDNPTGMLPDIVRPANTPCPNGCTPRKELPIGGDPNKL